MSTRIADGNATNVTGSEKIPVSGDNYPVITPDLIATYFGTWTDWTPSFTGFSSDPTYTARYIKIGKLCICYFFTGSGGTSNSADFTMTMPFNAKRTSQGFVYPVRVRNNSSVQVDPGLLAFTSDNSNVATIYRTLNAQTFTASGSKGVDFIIAYEIF